MGRIAFASKVAVGAFGKNGSVIGEFGTGVSLSDKGWKGVRVGVAFAGAVTRYRVVGEAPGDTAGEFTKGAAQPVKRKMMSVVVRSVLFMTFHRLFAYFLVGIFFGKAYSAAKVFSPAQDQCCSKAKNDLIMQTR